MYGLLFTITVTLTGLMILVFVHELGHFFFAKLFGVRCDVFSIGFGRRLFGFKLGQTDYRVSAVPLGGYVRLAGHENLGERPHASDELGAKPWYARFLVFFGGPLFNVLFALLVFTIYFTLGRQRPEAFLRPPLVGYVLEHTSGYAAGVQEGDLIRRVNGREVRTWEQTFQAVHMTQDEVVDLLVERNGQELSLVMNKPATREQEPDYPGFSYNIDPVISEVMPDSPAAEAGVQPGDVVVAIDGSRIDGFQDIRAKVTADGEPRPMELLLQRGARQVEVAVQPRILEGNSTPMLGIVAANPQVRVGDPLPEAFRRGTAQTSFWTTFIFRSLGKLLSVEDAAENIGGPAVIAKVTADAAREGFGEFLFLLGILSVNLALMNLLPIPVLDGGHILFLFMELLMGEARTNRVRIPALQLGLLFLLGLTVLVILNDVRLVFTKNLFGG